MDHAILQIVMRYVHIVSAILLVGGVSFLLLVLRPACRLLDEGFRQSLEQMIQARFRRLVWFSIAGLLVSGAYTWLLRVQVYKEMGPAGNALIGAKVLLAVIIFALIWARHAGMIKLPVKVMLMINVHLAAIVILLAAILRYLGSH